MPCCLCHRRRTTRHLMAIALLAAAAAARGATAQAAHTTPQAKPTLLPGPVVEALAAELSGTAAKQTVQEITLFHRMRGSRAFQAVAERIRAHLLEAGLAQAAIIELPADGVTFYGTQRSRPGWDADFAELWEQRPAAVPGAGAGDDAGGSAAAAPGAVGGGATAPWNDALRIASWDDRPVTLAEDSAGGEVTADLVDVGDGTAERDYQGKDVHGKIVLAASQPGAVYPLAVDRFGAAAIVSYAQNQVTAWWREDDTLVRWGHLQTFPAPSTFAFMVSLGQARAWQERLAHGGVVRLRASVRAGQRPSSYLITTAVIPGRDPALRDQEIVFSCHLDHLRPGANDNASGCATILEVARTLHKLIAERKLPAPRRTLRFIWPSEIEGTLALLNARPEEAARARAVIHLDMVGGEAHATKAVFHVTRGPRSLPTFVNDVGEAFGRFVNAQSNAYAGTGSAAYPLIDPQGSKSALQAELVDFTEGSDHQIWTEGSWRVPAIYLNDWPDRYIHTSADTIANIDATKLLRAAFIAAASGYYLAQLDSTQVPALWEVIRRQALGRAAAALARCDQLRTSAPGGEREAANLLRFHLAYEAGVVRSVRAFAALPAGTERAAGDFLADLGRLLGAPADAGAGRQPSRRAASAAAPAGGLVYLRNPQPKGPASGGFGYDYLGDQLARLKLSAPALLDQTGLWGGGADYAYEALNLVDGQRSVSQVHDDLAAIYGPLPLAPVAEYLSTLERIGMLRRRDRE